MAEIRKPYELAPEDQKFYEHCIAVREQKIHTVRNIPQVIVHYGQRIEIEGWHASVPRFRLPDGILEANHSAGAVVTGNRPNLRNRKFGKAQKRHAPTKERGK